MHALCNARWVAATAPFGVIVVHRMTGMTAYNAAPSRAAAGADWALS